MTVSAETWLLRGKRSAEKWMACTPVREGARALGWTACGLMLSGARILGSMMPIAAGLAGVCGGGASVWAGAGSMLGYWLFFGREGIQGVFWTGGAVILSQLQSYLRPGSEPDERTCWVLACMVSFLGVVFRLVLQEPVRLGVYLLRVGAAAGAAALFRCALWQREPLGQLAGGAGVLLGLVCMPVWLWLHPGLAAAGLLACQSPMGAVLAGAAVDLAGITAVPMSLGLGLGALLRLVPWRWRWMQKLGIPLGLLAAMALTGRWDLAVIPMTAAGGWLGSVLPWRLGMSREDAQTALLQTRMEQTARLMERLGQLLSGAEEPPVDEEALGIRVRENACRDCPVRRDCDSRNQLDRQVLADPLSFHCRRIGRVLPELKRVQDQRKLMALNRSRQREYRRAVLQQYGMLAEYFRCLGSRLTQGDAAPLRGFRLQISARTKGRNPANGDRCIAFSGPGVRHYVVLCDGMGSGLGAAQEAESAARLLRQMLTAGMPARFALGSLNSQLILRSQAGAVTVDLLELRLDSGRASIYKWGAAPSILIRRNQAETVGEQTPPPGVQWDLRETVVQLSLCRGETLVLVSDGIDQGTPAPLAEQSARLEPGELAQWVVDQWGSSGEDDATAAVIRLLRT